MSERVEKEFKVWQEKYDIPYKTEFQVKTLLKLQEEYDTIKADSSNTRTRETLLKMIEGLQMRLSLTSKEKNKYSMFIDVGKSESNSWNVLCFVEGRRTKLYDTFSTIDTLCNSISKYAVNNNLTVCIDDCVYERLIYENLINLGVKCEKLTKLKLN